MSKMKKILMMSAAYVLVAALAIGGTLAYLQSEDSDVNVMTLGNVDIEQLEYERVVNEDGTYPELTTARGTGYELKEFTQAKPLYPEVGAIEWDETYVWLDQLENGAGGMQVFGFENAVDKFVVVENTGKSDAYVRTLIAFEIGDATVEEWDELIGYSNHFTWDKPEEIGVITVGDSKYMVVEFVYKGAGETRHKDGVLPVGDKTYNSLGQIYMSSKATNEDVEKLDGNKNGTYDVLVLSQAVQTEGFENAITALDTAFGDTTVELAAEWFSGVVAKNLADVWDGSTDTTWYNDTDTEFVITTAEQLAGFAELVDDKKTFEGKTVKLGKNIDLGVLGENNEPICFNPIGSYRNDNPFKGTFDGQSYTISNLSQNTWALNNGYYYGDLGLGLFGLVEDATVKNLKMDEASISGESAICGIVAATAYGNCTFENITVANSEAADYQYYAGGIVGWASGDHKYINCDVEASTTIAAQWGDFDNSTGGVIGGCGGSATIYLKDCDVACRIDAYNDVTSSYQWYAYRRCGMLIGNTGKTTDIDGTTKATAPQLTAENCTVTYGDWANYTYCEFAGQSWPYVRVQAGVSNSAYSNPRYGHPKDANGNEVIDDNHVHNEGENHHILCVFDQLYGGGQGVYGTATHDGVTVIYNNK